MLFRNTERVTAELKVPLGGGWKVKVGMGGAGDSCVWLYPF